MAAAAQQQLWSCPAALAIAGLAAAVHAQPHVRQQRCRTKANFRLQAVRPEWAVA